MTATFWQGKRVFLTGHTGFKGGWLALWLADLGAEVHGYALAPPTDPSFFSVCGLHSRLTSSTIADVCDAAATARALQEARPEIVLHLAAQSLVRPSYSAPVETYAVNVMGTVHLLEAVRRAGCVRAVVVVTSDKCYENQESRQAYREADPMGGFDPYSSSKGCAELVTSAYRRSFFPPERYGEHGCAIATARAGNVVGGGDWAVDRLVPDLIRSLAASQPARIRNPQAVRPWQHVLDVVHGYLLLAERLCTAGPDFSGAWNFGPAAAAVVTVSDLADRLVGLWGKGASWVDCSASGQPHEAAMLRLDSSKARTRLGWSSHFDLDASLAAVVDWVQAYQAGQDMRQVTLGQLRRFRDTLS